MGISAANAVTATAVKEPRHIPDNALLVVTWSPLLRGHYSTSEVRPSQGLLDRLSGLDQQKGHHLHGACPQAVLGAEDLLGLQAQGHEGDEEFRGPSHNWRGRSGRDGRRGPGRGRAWKEEQEKEACCGRHREEGQGGLSPLRPGYTQGWFPAIGWIYERPHKPRGQSDHRPMDRICPPAEGVQEPLAHTFGQKRDKFPGPAQSHHEPQGMAAGHAPPCR